MSIECSPVFVYGGRVPGSTLKALVEEYSSFDDFDDFLDKYWQEVVRLDCYDSLENSLYLLGPQIDISFPIKESLDVYVYRKLFKDMLTRMFPEMPEVLLENLRLQAGFIVGVYWC